MRYAFPPYDFIIIAGLTFLGGFILKKTIFKNKILLEKYRLVPYAIIFLFVSFGFAFIVDELPLKLYAYAEFVYDPQSQMGPNPQGPTGDAVKFVVLYLISVFINLVFCGYCLILLARYFFSLRKKKAG